MSNPENELERLQRKFRIWAAIAIIGFSIAIASQIILAARKAAGCAEPSKIELQCR